MSRRGLRSAIGALLMAVAMLGATTAAPGASADTGGTTSPCPNFGQPLCKIQLSTGITMAYLDIGPTKAKRTVIMMHGYTDSFRSYEKMVPVLQSLMPDTRFILLDMRGHDQTSLPNGQACADKPESCFQFTQMTDDVVALMDSLKIAKADFVGHSTGTIVAQEMGLSHPDRTDHLILLSTAAFGADIPALDGLSQGVVDGDGLFPTSFRSAGIEYPSQAYKHVPADAVPAPDLDGFIDGFVSSPIADPALIDEIRPITKNQRIGTWVGELRNIPGVDNRVRLEHLQARTLALYAIQDELFDQAREDDLIKHLQAARDNGGAGFCWKQYGKVPRPADGTQTDFAHNFDLEAPSQIANDIAAFVKNGEPTHTLSFADPNNPRHIIDEPGDAKVICSN